MTTKIRQCGVIESLNGSHARIQIMRSSACQTCEASNGCKVHSSKTMYVDVEDKRLAKYNKGDRVHVEMTAKSQCRDYWIRTATIAICSLSACHSLCRCKGRDSCILRNRCAFGLLPYYIYGKKEHQPALRNTPCRLPIKNS